MTEHDTLPNAEKADERQPGEPRIVVESKALFGEAREIVIEHEGDKYRLRITRRGRLILSK